MNPLFNPEKKKRPLFLKLMVPSLVFFFGCASLDPMLSSRVETPELKTDRSFCRAEAEKTVDGLYGGKILYGFNSLKKAEKKRKIYQICMQNKGYDRWDRKTN